jgi:hypothetical protein
MGKGKKERRQRRKAKKAKNLRTSEAPTVPSQGRRRFTIEVTEESPAVSLSEEGYAVTLFEELGIDCSKPGFYDDSRFVEVEKREPRLLEAYADYINELTFSKEYVARARRTILDAANFMYARLLQEGLKGACLDSALAMLKFLEKDGVWAYVVIGGLTVSFSPETGLTSLHIAPITMGDSPAKVGHAWLCAPPFKVVDIASSLQPYRNGEEKYLPGVIAEESVLDATPDVLDLFDVDAAQNFVFRYGRMPTLRDIEYMEPGLVARAEHIGTFSVHAQHATLKYVSCGIAASDTPFEQVTNIKLGGKYPVELYEEFQASRGNCPINS